MFDLVFKLNLEFPVSGELMIAAFETYRDLVSRLGAVAVSVALKTDPVGPEYIRAIWYLCFKISVYCSGYRGLE